ncbi:MAG: PilZ domain-containing protein [Phycisphaerae bacterium]|nr:PilZ domain-containing protein [Phycisphaerae bacterium]
MLEKGCELFVEFARDAESPVLHAATVIRTAGPIAFIDVREGTGGFEAGQEIVVYHTISHRFVKQAAHVVEILALTDQTLVGIETISEPVSAENRECYRVSTVLSGLTVDIGPEQGCPVLDISLTGMAAAATGTYRVGQILDTTLIFEDQQFAGRMQIMNCRDAGRGQHRYGLHGLDDRRHGGELQKGLRQATMALQRQQQRRRAALDA